MTATIEPWLRAILRSPGGQHRLIDHDGPDGPELACPALGIAYPVVDGIPVLLQDEARELTAEEIEALGAGPEQG